MITCLADKCEYDNLEKFIHCGLLGFCGCGTPSIPLDYILGAFELLNSPGTEDMAAYDKYYDERWDKLDAYFSSVESKYFFYYWADKEGYTEHGGSVPGWLTDKGKEMLACLKQWKATENTE